MIVFDVNNETNSFQNQRWSLDYDSTLYVAATVSVNEVQQWQFADSEEDVLRVPLQVQVAIGRRASITGSPATPKRVLVAKLYWHGKRPQPPTPVMVLEEAGAKPDEEATDPNPQLEQLGTPIGWVLEILALDEALTVNGENCLGIRVIGLRTGTAIQFGRSRILTVISL